MILTVCTSPCLDVTTYVDKQGNCIKPTTSVCGGKGINVAVGARRLGGEPFLLGVMFDENKREFTEYLQSENVSFSFVTERGCVRKNNKLFDGETLIEQNQPATPITQQSAEQILQQISRLSAQSQATVLSGSLPKNLSPSFYKSMAQAVDKSSYLIIDATGENLRQGIAANREIDFIKPNLQELAETTGEQITDLSALKRSCQKLIAMGAKRVLVSLGKQGAVITDGKTYYHAKSDCQAVNSTVGAGDAMVAAVALQQTKDNRLQALLRAGIAAGTARVTERFTQKDYEQIFLQTKVKEI